MNRNEKIGQFRRIASVLLTLAVLGLLSIPAFAQDTTDTQVMNARQIINVRDDQNNPITGAVFDIRDDNDKVLETITSDANGQAKILTTENGTYRLIQTATAEGYTIIEEQPIEIVGEDPVHEDTIVNPTLTEPTPSVEPSPSPSAEVTPSPSPSVSVTPSPSAEAQIATQSLETQAANAISYRTHVQNIGWQAWRNNNVISGTSGQSLRLEAVQIKSNIAGLGVTYSAHVQNIGWQSWVSDGATGGTSGRSLRVEAFKIKLTGNQAGNYDIYYRVHVQNFGWLGWAKNGEEASSAGYSARAEAIQIQVVPKGQSVSTGSAAYVDTRVSYTTHVQDIGWQSARINGATAGTTGLSKRIEAIKITATGGGHNLALSYNTHLANIGWQGFKSSGQLSGTTGQARQVEAIQIKLTGSDANNYDVFYRVHSQNFGWLGWAKNGESAGTAGYAYRMESIQIKVLPKNCATAPSTGGAYSVKTYNVNSGATGVDVSYWNGYNNNWNSAKAAGVQFAFLRTSYGWSGHGGKDSTFEGNYARAKAAGVAVGVYHYSLATNTAQARAEAQFVLSILKGRSLELPVAFDVEDSDMAGLSRSQITDIIVTFCETIRAGGYKPMVYANLNWFNNKIDYSRVKGYKIWLAQYNDKPTFGQHFDVWQYSSKGRVNGLGGSYVDMNRAYTSF